MTRETKIGLLIGLGFIVVFAVLLSHTGTPVPRGDGLVMGPMSKASPAKLPMSSNQLSPGSSISTGVQDLGSSSTRPAGRVGLGEIPGGSRGLRDFGNTTSLDDRLALLPLPEPKGLVRNRTASDQAGAGKPVSPWEKILAGAKPAEDGASVATAESTGAPLPAQRVAPARQELITVMQPPQVATPEPGARPQSPAGTQAPEAPSEANNSDNAPKAPPARQEAPKEYIVQKGDTLRKIVKDKYGISSTKAVEFLVASNKGRIKDKDTIIEGQKLMLPPLPPEMFERAPNFDVSGLGDEVRTVTSEELSRNLGLAAGKQRTAPELVKSDGDAATKSSSLGYRVVEIRAKDTLRSIAARELGSVNYWDEIQKLNPSLDPRKLRPGSKIRIPAKRPLSEAGNSKRVSA